MIRGKQRVNLFLRPETVYNGKVKALQDKMSFSRVVENALIHYMSKFGDADKK